MGNYSDHPSRPSCIALSLTIANLNGAIGLSAAIGQAAALGQCVGAALIRCLQVSPGTPV